MVNKRKPALDIIGSFLQSKSRKCSGLFIYCSESPGRQDFLFFHFYQQIFLLQCGSSPARGSLGSHSGVPSCWCSPGHSLPAQKRDAAEGSFPKAFLDLQKVPVLLHSSSLLLHAVPSLGCCARPSWAGGAARRGPGSPALCWSTNTHSSALAPLTQGISNHRHVREPHGIGSS